MVIRKSYQIVGGMVVLAFLGGLILGRYRWAPSQPSATQVADNMVQISSPLPGSKVSSPLVIKGQARGTWFFEASFPVVLTDWDGKVLAQGVARAKSDWMTSDFVPFEATLNFTVPAYGDRGVLVLKKDNPSGDSSKGDSREITVFFR